MEEMLIGIILYMVVGLVLNNLMWLVYFRKTDRDKNAQMQTLLNRIQQPNYITPVETDTEVPERPNILQEMYSDPEYEAVGKINPDYIEGSRNGN